MDIYLINFIKEIRDYNKANHTVTEPIVLLNLVFYDPQSNKQWRFPIKYLDEINYYFPYDGEFSAWLSHKVENPYFEKEMDRYLKLKAFI